MNLVEIAKSLGARVNWRTIYKDGWWFNSAEVNSVNLTPSQLHAYTEQVCKQMVEALEMVANRPNGMWYGIDDKVKEALAAHREMMGDRHGYV